MGGANFMGRDKGLPQSKQLDALGLACIWLIGGLPIMSFISILIFPTPNYIMPISVYGFGLLFLFGRYLKLESKGETQWIKKN